MKYLYFSLFFAACAQPSNGRTNSTTTAGTTGSTTGSTTAGTTGSTTAGTTGSTTAGTTGSTTAGTTGGNADMGPVDMAMSMNDLAGSCDLFTQAGCNPGTEKCVPSTMGNVCASQGATTVPTAGLCLASMTPPSTNDQCVAGDGCITWSNFDNSKQVAMCQEWCLKDADCSQPTFAGSIAPKCSGELQGTTAYKVCSVSCMPYGAANGTLGCPMGLACSAHIEGTMPNFFEVTDCAHFGTGDGTTDCTAHGNEDCKPGWACVNVSGGSNPGTKCHQICRAGMNGDCSTGGQLCNTDSRVASPKFGVCI